MGRVGDALILIPEGVTVEKMESFIKVTGPKGALKFHVEKLVSVDIAANEIVINKKNDQKRTKALQGLVRSIIVNMIKGVTEGWSKNLELIGVGFRVQGGSDHISLNVGYSHPVEIKAPEGISFEISDNTKIKVIGIDKQLVGQVAANIRKVRKPDVYKGKGIRMMGEYVRKKLGKSGKIGAPGTPGGAA